jgi:dihydroorotate dehydrogenase (fumarate)/dihydroorotate dehydrogenase
MMGLYKSIAQPLLFRIDPEAAHRLALAAAAKAAWAGRPLGKRTAVTDGRLHSTVAGLSFPTPIGLAAGFDKSGTAVDLLAGLGFGSIEVGSVSAEFSAGNPRPRLFRLPADRAIAVAYGVPNDGASAVAARLQRARLPVPLGINIVKTNRGRGAPPESADEIIADYVASARLLAPVADYLMLNLSCPNTADGRDFFTDRAHLDACLAALGEVGLTLPVFLKVSPLGGIETIERVLAAAEGASYVSGFMFNLPPGKPAGLKTPEAVWRDMPGAVSGPPSAPLSEFCIRETWRRMDRSRYVLIGAGGVGSGEDAYRMLKSGASLVQMLTALIYEGPGVVRRVTLELLALMDRDGVRRVSEIVGAEA